MRRDRLKGFVTLEEDICDVYKKHGLTVNEISVRTNEWRVKAVRSCESCLNLEVRKLPWYAVSKLVTSFVLWIAFFAVFMSVMHPLSFTWLYAVLCGVAASAATYGLLWRKI